MTHPGHAPFNVVLGPRARSLLDSLSPRYYGRAMATVHDLVDDPHPDDETRISMPFPFPFGTLAYRTNGFFITYRIENVGTIRVLNIVWENPDYWG